MLIDEIDSCDALSRYISTTGWPEFLYFWGHTATEGAMDKHVLSQWWHAPFTVAGVQYATAEHFMMAEKAQCFGDHDTLARILSAATPAEAKQLGRIVKGFNEAQWVSNRLDVAYRGNLAKYSQHAALRKWLVATGDCVPVEASPVDSIWGVGLAADDEAIHDPDCWRGLNLLGFTLVKVRRALKAEDKAVGDTISALSEAWGKVKSLQSVASALADQALVAATRLLEKQAYHLSYRSDLIKELRHLADAYSAEAPYMRRPMERESALEYERKFQNLVDRLVQRTSDPT
jgi:ribA/ribD-fused uncharacterized protein